MNKKVVTACGFLIILAILGWGITVKNDKADDKGMWIWDTAAIIEKDGGIKELITFANSHQINVLYVYTEDILQAPISRLLNLLAKLPQIILKFMHSTVKRSGPFRKITA